MQLSVFLSLYDMDMQTYTPTYFSRKQPIAIQEKSL